jgi:hypothetical protein
VQKKAPRWREERLAKLIDCTVQVPFSSKQEDWFDLECVNTHTGQLYKLVAPTTETTWPGEVVFPSQFARLLKEYQQHPEAKSLAPDRGHARRTRTDSIASSPSWPFVSTLRPRRSSPFENV